jgi:ribosome-associated heat shock protein Hsp15
MRVDRWLWVSRHYKTRSLATEACKKNWVKLDGSPIKPSKEIKNSDILYIKIGPLNKVIRVTEVAPRRLSASLAQNLYIDLTSPDEKRIALEKKVKITPTTLTKKGIGRPTKKQRRDLEEFLYPMEET